MSAIRIILLTALAISLVPLPTTQAYSCNNVTQSRAIAGNTATVVLQNCQDSYSYGTYTSQYLANTTIVTVDSSEGYRVIAAAQNSWYHATDSSNGYETTQRNHYYQVFIVDMTSTQELNSAGTGLGNGHSEDNSYGCFETTGASASAYSPDAGFGENQNVNGGNTRTLPSTSSDVQNALP